MVDSLVTLLGQGHHPVTEAWRNGIGWPASPIPVGQRGGALLPVCRQNSPKMALAQPQDLGRLFTVT